MPVIAARTMSLLLAAALAAAAQPALLVPRALLWNDLPLVIQRRLETAGIAADGFTAYRDRQSRGTRDRVLEGDLDAVIFFALQSTAFTQAPPIEPALSAKALVEGLGDDARRRYLAGDLSAVERLPAPVQERLTALLAALRTAPEGSRTAYAREILNGAQPTASERTTFLRRQYARAMRFLYEKEFVAQQAGGADAVAALYRDRGLSTDTAVEAGYLVHLGLATLKAVEPMRRIRRVLVIGPGLDLAPRTGLIDVADPETYQPYAIIDALLSLGLSQRSDLVVVGADINPRVVRHLQSASSRDVFLMLVTGIGDSATVTLERDYQAYVERIGESIGTAGPALALPGRFAGHLRKTVRVRPDINRLLTGVQLDVATDRLAGETFDLVVATNVLPYLDDTLLTMALANVAAALGPGGVFLHNEPRALLGEVTRELGLPLRHGRSGAIAAVRGAAPLADTVWLHERAAIDTR